MMKFKHALRLPPGPAWIVYASAFVALLWGTFLRVRWRVWNKLWVDEMYQIQLLDHSLFDFFRALRTHEYCPFLSGDLYLTYPFFHMFGENKWGLAIPHMIATLLGYYLLFVISSRMFKTVWGYIITFFVFAFNQTLIEHALEIRTYAVLPTLALACYYFGQGLIEEHATMSRRKRACLSIFYFIVILWHAYGPLVAAYPLIFLLGTKLHDRDFFPALKGVIKFLLPVLIVALPIWYANVHRGDKWEWGLITFLYIPNPLTDFTQFLKSTFGNLLGYKKFYFLYLGLPIAFLTPSAVRYKQIAFFCLLIIIPLQIFLLADLRSDYYYIQRQFIGLIPYMALLLGWCWETVVLYFTRSKQGVPENI